MRACRADIVTQEEAGVKSRDILVQFIQSLLVEFDFTTSGELLQQARTILAQDFFLNGHAQTYIDGARAMIAETYFKVHDATSTSALVVDLLGFEHGEEGERWLVSLIRDARIDARLDFEQGIVRVQKQFPGVHQMVIERTKGVQFRTTVMATKLEKRKSRKITVQPELTADA